MTREHIPQQVEAIAEEFSPDVVRIEWDIGEDWADIESLLFLIVVSDASANNRGGLFEMTQAVKHRLHEAFSGLRMPMYYECHTVSRRAKKEAELRRVCQP